MLKSLAILVATTFLPGLELRASIPVGFFGGDIRATLGLPGVVATCLVANTLLGMLVFAFMRFVELVLRKWGWFERNAWPFIESRREKLRPLTEKYGALGVALFIGVPLPGTGAYAGAVGAYLLRLDRRKFWIANLLGVCIAAAAVTAICILIDCGAVAEDGFIRRLFIK